jgi:hypothetical protein
LYSKVNRVKLDYRKEEFRGGDCLLQHKGPQPSNLEYRQQQAYQVKGEGESARGYTH